MEGIERCALDGRVCAVGDACWQREECCVRERCGAFGDACDGARVGGR